MPKRRQWVALVALLLVTAFCAGQLVWAAAGFKLKRVYRSEKYLLTWPLVVLDPDGRYLYLVAGKNQSKKIHVIDWRNRKEVTQLDLSLLPCDFSKVVTRLEFVPSSRYIHLQYCLSDFLIDSDTGTLVRTLIEHNKERGGVVISPTGEFALIHRWAWDRPGATSSLFRLEPWNKVAEWAIEGDSPRFTPDGNYIVTIIGRYKPHPLYPRGTRVACGLAFYAVPSGELAQQWLVEEEHDWAHEDPCPRASSPFIPGTRYLMVENVWGLLLAVRNAWDGRTLRTFQEGRSLSTNPSVSADGRFVVVGAWDTLDDNSWSRDFIVWDLERREVAHRTAIYLSGFGKPWREVYPHFSYDGKYLIVVKNGRVELFQVFLLTHAGSAPN